MYNIYIVMCDTEDDQYAYIEYSDKKPNIQDWETCIKLSNQLDEFIDQIRDFNFDISGLEKFEIKFNPKFPIPEIER